jgi:hypothetical protein
MHNHEHKVNIKVKPIEGLCIDACLAQSELWRRRPKQEGGDMSSLATRAAAATCFGWGFGMATSGNLHGETRSGVRRPTPEKDVVAWRRPTRRGGGDERWSEALNGFNGDRCGDVWWPSGWRHPTSGSGASLNATDKWAILNSFSKLNLNAEIWIPHGKYS